MVEGVDERVAERDPQPLAARIQADGTAVARRPRRGDEIEVHTESFDDRGSGIGRVDGMRVRMRRALPGDVVRARVLRRRGTSIDAAVVKRISPSADRVVPRCEHFGSCGGCTFQDLAYETQLRGLRELVADAFRAHGLASGIEVEPVLPAPDGWHYRNKMELTFGSRRWLDPSEPPGAPDDFALGFHARGMHTKVVDVRACAIQAPIADAIAGTARDLARERRIPPWDIRTHTGLLRHLVLRVARATGEVMVNLVTSSASPEIVDDYAAAIVARHREITTFVQNVNTRKAAIAVGEWERVLHGRGVIHERVLGRTFAISANSFFQTNSAQAELLFALVREAAQLSGRELVLDLYCGAGAIAIVLADGARQVIGLEQNPAAILDARRNAELNSLANVQFVEGDVLAGLASMPASSSTRPDLCVVDPPRAGLHPRLLPRLAELSPARIVYVSCNPKAAARDVRWLTDHGYAIERIRPVDLFPHTPHVECVIGLRRADVPREP
jgi:23S rRNA (uracil1939-C5)-methyltransferase